MADGVKASDIPDQTFLDTVRACGRGRSGWAMEWDVTARLGYPRKVVLAKARKLIKRGLMDGCACGCRGDWVPR